MIGTIAHQELLLASRRYRLYIFRWLYFAWLLFQLFLVFVAFLADEQRRLFASHFFPQTPRSAPHIVGVWFSSMFVTQLFIFLAIATPALAAGAITDEKRRGTLQYLLLCDVDSRTLLSGKLLGKALQVASLALMGLPLFALMAGFGGVEPLTMVAIGVLAVVAVFAMSAAALLASVWCRQTRDAVLVLYGAGVAAGVVVWQGGGDASVLNPLGAFDSDLDGGVVFHRLLETVFAWLLAGFVCFGLAVWRLKPAYLRQLEGTPQSRSSWYGERRPLSADEDPIHWREQNVEGLAPAPGLRRIPYRLAFGAVAVASMISSSTILALTAGPGTNLLDLADAFVHFDLLRVTESFSGADEGFFAQGIFVMLTATLVVGIRCSGAITGERERQTWELLLLTPLSARELIAGKLWGVMGASYGYLVAYGIPAVFLSLLAGPSAAIWTLVWLAVTVVAMYFIGAAGLWASVRSKSSWRALLWTLATGYVGGALVNACCSFIVYMALVITFLSLSAIDARLQSVLASYFLSNIAASANLYLAAVCISLALSSWLLARYFFLNGAQEWISRRERLRHWKMTPVYRRAKRRRPRHLTG